MAAAAFERVVTGVSLWLLRAYLEELGGQPGADGLLRGDGWQAWLTQVEDYQIGSLRVGQVRWSLAAKPRRWAGCAGRWSRG